MFSIIFLLLLFGASCHASRVLVVSPLHYKSHFLIASALVKELADKGHSVTLISQYELNYSNVESVVLSNQKDNSNVFSLADISIITNFIVVPQIAENAVNSALSHEKVVALLKEKFDVVIVEVFMMEALYGLGMHYDCPVIGLTTFGVSMWTNLITRTPYPTSYVPNLFTPYSDKMNFIERFYNTFIWSVEEILWHLIHYPKQVALYEKFFPQKKPVLMDVVRNVSLVLNNNHFSTSTIKPYVPSVVDIGGIYIQPAKALPKIFQDFLDSASDGAIVFSMGSCIQATDWPAEKREILTRVFGKLKQKVIWKYENETLPGKPDNVMIHKWLPQRDILAHPNIKLFITHGGLLGTTEAYYEGIPLLAIPIYGDQRMNMKVASEKGMGLVLDFHTFNERDLMNALDEILNRPKIAERVRELSRIYKDRPMTPQATAVYWTEYVIRHKGAPHLRSAALTMSYFEFYNIDVYLVVGVFLSSIICAVVTIVCKIFTRKTAKIKTQ